MKKNLTKNKAYILFFIFVSLLTGFFYFFFVNLSMDTVLLFLASRMFEGHWLAKGILPLFNPHIFAGVPFGFDSALGTLHPMNLLFIFPYPLSLSLWVFITSFIFLTGFFFLFANFTKTKNFAFFLTLLLFFSGSGVVLRMNNPTILIVVAHFGWLLYFIKDIGKEIKYMIPALAVGILMTISGHIQSVIYGYILVFVLASVFYKIKLSKILTYFILLALFTCWFFILSFPLSLNSTRFGSQVGYKDLGKLSPFQLIQFFLPFGLGHISDGSSWNAGPSYISIISPIFTLLLTGVFFLLSKIRRIIFFITIGSGLILAMGIINLPFFRGAAQAIMFIHILGLCFIAESEEKLFLLIKNLSSRKNIWLVISLIFLGIGLFFFTPLFSKVFVFGYTFIKKRPMGLFFDLETIGAVGKLLGGSLFLISLLSVLIYSILKFKKYLFPLIFVYIIMDGLILNYFHNYFIPTNLLSKKTFIPSSWNTDLYRVQTEAEVRPYFGFNTYMGDVMFRPPFSKEKTLLTQKEEHSREYFSYIWSMIPSSWADVSGIKAVQGYNTFVPMKVGDKFTLPSADINEAYKDIISRNSLFLEAKNVTHINSIDSSRITLTDPRWRELGVKYYISGHKLKGYRLVDKKRETYYYEDAKTKPIYRIEFGNKITPIIPVSEDPNKLVFDIKKEFLGSSLVLNINSSGFVAKSQRLDLDMKKIDFEMRVPINFAGKYEIYYSPWQDLRETFSKVK